VLLLGPERPGAAPLGGGRSHLNRLLQSRVLVKAIHRPRILDSGLRILFGLARGGDAILVDEGRRVPVLLAVRVEPVLFLFIRLNPRLTAHFLHVSLELQIDVRHYRFLLERTRVGELHRGGGLPSCQGPSLARRALVVQ